MVHGAIDKMFQSVKRKGHNPDDVKRVNITKRFNGQSGVHVHASCAVTLRFDESVAENSAEFAAAA
jgi:hypothetical protein